MSKKSYRRHRGHRAKACYKNLKAWQKFRIWLKAEIDANHAEAGKRVAE